MWIEEIIPPGTKFSEHCGKALRNHERALFYSVNINKKPLAKIKEDAKGDDIRLITLLYKDSGALLFERLYQVTAIFSGKHKNRSNQNITDHDRGAIEIGKSRNILIIRFKRLYLEILKRGRSDKEKEVGSYAPGWESLHGMCELIMDEISFLEKRIHDLDGIRKVQRGFYWALAGIAISLFAAGTTLSKGYWWGVREESRNAKDKRSEYVLIEDFQKLINKLDKRFESNSAPIDASLSVEVSKLTKSIDAHAKAMSGDAPDGLLVKLGELNKSVSEIETAIRESKSLLTAEDITTLQSQLNEISNALGQIAPAIAGQKAPVVNVTPHIEIKAPNQTLSPPDKKAIGLINIDASKVGASETEKPDQSEKSRLRLNPPHR